ncbi:unnamed protein product [Urochloa decumbens]|uniref:Uncharacterized protein n=1 Tax=Urochloa decumbens TaxID=240449 RepID=A0ABC8XDI4_9POAL
MGPRTTARLGPPTPSIQTSRWPPVERRSESRSSATPPTARRSRRRRPPLDLLASASRFSFPTIKMSRGGSAGGGQSQLNYLFGGGDAPAPKPAAAPAAPAASAPPAEKPAPAKPDVTKQIPAGVTSQTNNYHRADGQNTGNFLTDRPSTKVHAAPGGGSQLDYLFGGK